MKKRLHLKKFKQQLQDDMLANVWDGSYQDKRRNKAQALADHFGVNLAYLLGFTDSPADNLRDLLFHEIKALKEYRVLRCGFENFISENDVLNVIDKYTKLTCREPR